MWLVALGLLFLASRSGSSGSDSTGDDPLIDRVVAAAAVTETDVTILGALELRLRAAGRDEQADAIVLRRKAVTP